MLVITLVIRTEPDRPVQPGTEWSGGSIQVIGSAVLKTGLPPRIFENLKPTNG